MAHPILTKQSCVVLVAAVGFFFYLSRAYTGPTSSKYHMPAKSYERVKGWAPEFAASFTPDTHPALKRESQ